MSVEKTKSEATSATVIEAQAAKAAMPEVTATEDKAPVSEKKIDKAVKAAGAARKAKKVTKKKIAGDKTVKAASASAKKGTDMFNFDSKQWMANFEMPTADKFEALVAETSKKNEELVRKTQAATEEFAELAKANIEAIVEAGRIAAQGAKSIGSELIEDGRDGMEKNAEAVKALTEVKSPTEFFQLQSEWMRSSFDQLVSESSKLTEKLIKLSGDAAQPVTSQASVNAEKVKGMMA